MARAEKPTDDIRAQLGRRVRELRERAGLTQSQLEAASTVSRVYLGVVERGEKEAGLSVLAKIARGLGVEPAELFRFDLPKVEAEPAPEAKLAKKIASLAKGASQAKLEAFESIAKTFFALEEHETKPKKGAARAAARPSSRRRRV